MAETARDTVIRGGRVLDVSSGTAPEIDLLIVNGIIADMGPPGLAAPAEALVLEATDRLLIPGLVNAHTHSHGALGRGAVEDRILLEQFLAAASGINGARTLEDKYLSAKLSAVEMVRRGCTSCYDMSVELPAPTVEGLHAIGQAYRDTGMRAVVAPMMADLTVYQAIPGLLDALPAEHRALVAGLRAASAATSLAACQAALRTWPFDRTLVRPGIAPTIPLHCSDEFLVGCHTLAKDFDVPLQTHLGETRTQAVAGRQRYGRSLTAHLSSLGLLDSLFSAAHGIWLDDQDMHLLAEAGVAGVSHNPMSNLRVGSGVAAVRRMISAGLTVGIGTDASNTSRWPEHVRGDPVVCLPVPDHGRRSGSLAIGRRCPFGGHDRQRRHPRPGQGRAPCAGVGCGHRIPGSCRTALRSAAARLAPNGVRRERRVGPPGDDRRADDRGEWTGAHGRRGRPPAPG
jgi:5-methylthioadenosine/S-adenosylhomocysteine deaminase